MSEDSTSQTAVSSTTPETSSISNQLSDLEKDSPAKKSAFMIPPDGGRNAWLTVAGAWVFLPCPHGT
jgi:hypothetical protein